MPLFVIIALFVVGVVVIGSIILWREARTFTILPNVANAVYRRGNLPVAIKLLEKVIETRSLLGERAKIRARFQLAFFYMSEQRFAEAEVQCRKLLEQRLKPDFETLVRKRLADTLEGQNRSDEATVELAKAGDVAQAPNTVDKYLSTGRLLAQQNKHNEACAAFEKAMALAVTPDQKVRTRVDLGLACYNAMRYEDAFRYCEEAIEMGAARTFKLLAHKTASIALTRLGRRDEALRYRETAVALARETKNPETIAETIALLADLVMQMGDLNEAMRLCEEARQMSLTARRMTDIVEGEALRRWGRFDEALDALRRSADAKISAIPATERRSQAINALGRARIYLFAGRPETAAEPLAQAEAEFVGDEKLNLWCRSARLWCDAQTQSIPLEKIIADEKELMASADKSPEPDIKNICYTGIARAAIVRQRWTVAIASWEYVLDLNQPPVDMPEAWFQIGAAKIALNDIVGAHKAWRHAVERLPLCDTTFTRQAQRRLQELDASLANSPAG